MGRGKVANALAPNDVITSVGALEVCPRRDVDDEALVYAMPSLYNEEETEEVLLVDAENASNAINQKVLHIATT